MSKPPRRPKQAPTALPAQDPHTGSAIQNAVDGSAPDLPPQDAASAAPPDIGVLGRMEFKSDRYKLAALVVVVIGRIRWEKARHPQHGFVTVLLLVVCFMLATGWMAIGADPAMSMAATAFLRVLRNLIGL